MSFITHKKSIEFVVTKNINENPNRYKLISNRSAIVNDPTLYLKNLCGNLQLSAEKGTLFIL